MELSKSAGLATVEDEILIANPKKRTVQMRVSREDEGKILAKLTSVYNRPLESTVREVISNALDAVAMSGVATPIEITSPTTMNPVFVVRDHGTGMSPDDVEQVYALYGKSTKENDFSAIGAHGLGAKAPLHYADAFTVETTKDGITSQFTVARGDGGMNELEITDGYTGRPSGTTVRIPVAAKDINQFAETISGYKQFALDAPIIIDGVEYSGHPGYLHLGDVPLGTTGLTGRLLMNFQGDHLDRSLKIIRDSSPPWRASPFILVGGWIYQGGSSWRGDAAFVLEVLPGVLSFNTSREAIEEDERLQAILDPFYSQVKSLLSKKDFLFSPEVVRLISDLVGKDSWSMLSSFHNDHVITADGGDIVFTARDGGDVRRLPAASLVDGSGVPLYSLLAEGKKTCTGLFSISERCSEVIWKRNKYQGFFNSGSQIPMDEFRKRIMAEPSKSLADLAPMIVNTTPGVSPDVMVIYGVKDELQGIARKMTYKSLLAFADGKGVGNKHYVLSLVFTTMSEDEVNAHGLPVKAVAISELVEHYSKPAPPKDKAEVAIYATKLAVEFDGGALPKVRLSLGTGNKVDLDELLAEDAVLLRGLNMSSSSTRGLTESIAGLINEGKATESTKFYATSGIPHRNGVTPIRDNSAQWFYFYLSHEKIYSTTRTSSGKSKAEERFRSERYVRAKFLNSHLDNLTRENVLAAWMSYANSPMETLCAIGVIDIDLGAAKKLGECWKYSYLDLPESLRRDRLGEDFEVLERAYKLLNDRFDALPKGDADMLTMAFNMASQSLRRGEEITELVRMVICKGYAALLAHHRATIEDKASTED